MQPASEEQLENKWEEIHHRIAKKKFWDREPKVLEAEMRNIIKEIANDTTPGPDIVVNPGPKTIVDDDTVIADLVERVHVTLKDGVIPMDWQDCNLRVLPKRNQDHRVLKGYKINTMANILMKLCEKIAAKIVLEQLERENKLPKNVGGARPRRPNVEDMIDKIQRGLQDSKCKALGLFDLEDEYNRVHIPTPPDKMVGYGLSDVLVRWILCRMLDSRRCRIQFDS